MTFPQNGLETEASQPAMPIQKIRPFPDRAATKRDLRRCDAPKTGPKTTPKSIPTVVRSAKRRPPKTKTARFRLKSTPPNGSCVAATRPEQAQKRRPIHPYRREDHQKYPDFAQKAPHQRGAASLRRAQNQPRTSPKTTPKSIRTVVRTTKNTPISPRNHPTKRELRRCDTPRTRCHLNPKMTPNPYPRADHAKRRSLHPNRPHQTGATSARHALNR